MKLKIELRKDNMKTPLVEWWVIEVLEGDTDSLIDALSHLPKNYAITTERM